MMNKKIIATIMALGMVVTAFTMVATPVKATVPTFNTINLLMEPVVTDNTAAAFSVVGACNVAVEAVLEVSLVNNFVKGTGTSFAATLDNNAQGTFKAVATGLLGNTPYYWRLSLTNGLDTIDFPNLATTRASFTCIPGTVPANGVSVGRVYGTANTTIMGANFLTFIQVETAGVQSIPMAVMSAATGNAVFIGNNMRRVSDTDYMQVGVGSIVRYGSYGNLWGTTWYNHTIPGGEPTNTVFPVGAGQCQLLAASLPGTYDIHVLPKLANPTATVTSLAPVTPSMDNTPDITYTTTNAPTSVDLYRATAPGGPYVLIGNDATPLTPYTVPVAIADGTYYFAASGLPAGEGVPTASEFGPYVIDATAPTQTHVPATAAVGVLANANVVVTYSEAMNPLSTPALIQTAGVPDVDPFVFGGWSVGNTVATFTHAANWGSLEAVTVEVSGATDVAGNPGPTASWSFTTAGINAIPTCVINSMTPVYVGQLPDDAALTVTGTDTDGGATLTGADYRVDPDGAGALPFGAYIPMTVGAAVGNTRTFTATPDLHNWTIGAKNVEARVYDGIAYNAVNPTVAYPIADTTAPVNAYGAGTPADLATRNTGMIVPIYVDYQDFRDYDPALTSYRVDPDGAGAAPYGAWAPMTRTQWTMGSNINDFQFTVTRATDGSIFYQYRVTDLSGNTVTSVARTLNFATAAAVEDPYTIYGFTTYYNGAAGVMEFQDPAGPDYWYGRIAPNSPVTITFVNRSVLAPLPYQTFNIVSDANGKFSQDIMNYSDGDRVWVNMTSSILGGNRGYNSTTVDIAGQPGGRRQDVMAAVPYDVVYNPVLVPLTAVVAGTPYAVNYEIIDIDGVRAQGYYTFGGGTMQEWSYDPLFTDDVAHPRTFNGIGGGNGFSAATVIFWTAGVQFVNTSEGGQFELNPYLTPWGAFFVQNGGATPGYLNDWANVTVTVVSDYFQWNLVDGWNIVCIPMNPDNDGLGAVPYFGAFDMVREIEADLGVGAWTVATRTGGNPSTYDTYDSGQAENGITDFTTDYTSGYWVFSPGIAGVVIVNAQNCSGVGDNVANLAAGWNLLGFTHNYSVGGAMPGGWNAQPTAVDFVDGSITAALATAFYGGAMTKIQATEWRELTQNYFTYVDAWNFAGMPTKVWTLDTQFAFGYWIWVSGPVVVTFNVNY